MNYRDIKAKEKPGPPKENEQQFGGTEHICENCGCWGILHWRTDCWVCDRCHKNPLRQQWELPY